MKAGSGFSGPMSKRTRICIFHGHSPVLRIAVLAVLSLSFILVGCGDLSLNQLLNNEEPGELSIIPTNAFVPASGTLDISGKGGFKPYYYENLGVGTIDATTGVYTAPISVSGLVTTQVEVTESLGRTASTNVTIFEPISINPAVKTIKAGQPVTFTASGGVPISSTDYEFYLDGVLQDIVASWAYTFNSEGNHLVEAVDSLGNSAASTVTVTGGLAIDVQQNWVVKGTGPDSWTDITALNQSSPHTFTIIDPQTGDPDVDGWIEHPSNVTATYHAPLTETVVTIELVDNNGDTVNIEIHVLNVRPEPLAFPTSVTVLVNQEVQLTATGGIEPHTFWLVGEGSLSSHPVQEYRIRYLAPDSPTTAYVWVQDTLGRQAKTAINVIGG